MTEPMMSKIPVKLFLFIISLVCAAPVYADEEPWYEPFFVEASVQQYAVPGLFTDFLKPHTGFRAALGYEYRHFRLALESGYTHIEGTNPLVLDLRFVPLVLKFGYALPIRWGLGVQADITYGFMFSHVTHYKNAIGLLMNKQEESDGRSPFPGARLYATYTIPQEFLKIYVGGGVDMITELEGPIPIPLFEAGVSFKPLMLIRPARQKRPARKSEAIVFAHTPENIVIEETERGKTVRLLNAVYFEADSANMIERYRPILDEAGRRLRSDPALRITLRGYTAPFGTPEGRTALSEARARYCMDYLRRSFGISGERIKIEYYGAERTPEFANADWESYRCVELIIE